MSIVTKDYLKAYRCILDQMIEGMTTAALLDSISYNFIVQMIPHHMGAIQMSQNLLQYTTCIPLQDIALRIIREQTQSIENMKKILCSCRECTSCKQDLQNYQTQMDRIIQNMFTHMEQACSDNQLNANFMREMIPHHLGAVRMSELTLSCRICPSLVPILEAIITSQERGIRQMRRLLQCTGR